MSCSIKDTLNITTDEVYITINESTLATLVVIPPALVYKIRVVKFGPCSAKNMIEFKDLEDVSEVGRDDTREDNPKSDESNEDFPQTVSKFTINSSLDAFIRRPWRRL